MADENQIVLKREVDRVALSNQSRFVIKRKFWSFLERKFYVWTHDGQPILFVKHPLFRFRDEFNICSDETETHKIYKLKSRQVIAINFNYDLTDAQTGALLATITKKGLKSLVRDTFLILDENGAEIGQMREHGAAILRRFFPWLTSRHEITMHGQPAATIQQVFRFFNKEFNVEINQGTADHRFVLACALLAVIAEARREDSNY